MGKCPECGAWDALEQFSHEGTEAEFGWAAGADGESSPREVARPLVEIEASAVDRLPTGLSELDRCLGGGMVAGSATLVGGDPGIGKSTLLLQAMARLAQSGTRVLYATSEESAQQVRMRAERVLPEHGAGRENLFLLAESSLARILEQARKVKPAAMVIDSIQMVWRHDLDSAPGSVAQLRRCALELVQLAKSSGCAVTIIGHVTKEGDLAGPKLLEHMVDVVLNFEGDRHHAHRIVRAVKNRFGSTHEIGLFEMTGAGLAEVDEGAFVAPGSQGRPGLVVFPTLAGSRCILAEVQALTATGFLGSAKRRSSGIDSARLTMLVAVLEKHAGLRLADQDVYAAVAGGLRIIEPAADLAVCVAVAGSMLGRSLAPGVALVGEVGLAGEIRAVPALPQRVAEALRRGCNSVVIPATQASAVKDRASCTIGVANLDAAIALLG